MEDDSSDQPKKSKTQTTSDNPKQKKWLVWLLVILVLLLLGVAMYLWLQLRACQDEKQKLEKDKQQLQEQLDAHAQQTDQNTSSSNSTACNDTPTATLKENIKAALDSKNTAAFATYTSNPVKFVLAASEKGGNETPDEAAVSLEYTHSATGPWDFTLPQATLNTYDAGFYTDYFDANTYVGRATSGMVVAFDFDCNGKISQIFVAADEDLL